MLRQTKHSRQLRLHNHTIHKSARQLTRKSEQKGARTELAGASPGEQEAPVGSYPQSFSAIAEMIATGNTDGIPNMRDIPLKINPEQPSESTMKPPRKPWETS